MRAITLGIPTWSFIILSRGDDLINEFSDGLLGDWLKSDRQLIFNDKNFGQVYLRDWGLANNEPEVEENQIDEKT